MFSISGGNGKKSKEGQYDKNGRGTGKKGK
jgi:hypothetical protein